MKLRKFKGNNLFSLGKVELDLADRGLTLITGYSKDEGGCNGAGKSSLANKALLWTLFGETAGGLRAGAVLNRHGKRKCFGEIEFEGVDGDTYTVRRERPAKLALFKGETDISAKTAKDTQSIVDGLLGTDLRTFVQTAFFGQGRNLAYASLPPKEQKAVLEQILPMAEVDEWAAYADVQLKKVKARKAEAEGELIRAETTLSTLIDQRERAERNGIAFEETRQKDKWYSQKQVETASQPFEKRRAELEITRQQVEQDDPAEIEKSIETLAGSILVMEAERQEAYNTKAQAHHSLSQWEQRKSFLNNEMSEIANGRNCPVCLRDYDDTTVAAVGARLKQQDALIAEAALNIEQATTAYNHYEERYRAADNDCIRLIDRRQELASRLHKKAAYLIEVEVISEKEKAATASAVAALEEIEKRVNPYVGQAQGMDEQIEEAKLAEKGAEGDHTKLKKEMEHLEYWKNVYAKELKLKLFEEACPFLDSRAAFHLERLKNAQMHIEFSTIKRLSNGDPKEEFNVLVWSETGAHGFDALSGGEQQMASFAIGLALADLASRTAGQSSSFTILDEPFSELDERNSEAIVEYLTSEVSNGRDTIFLISNEEHLKGLIQNRVHVVKHRGVTNVAKA
jgi:DNA repair exonuclease SbcCD ATPase subunit